MSAATDGPRLLGLRAASATFGVSYTFLYGAVRSEALPAIRPSREWLVEPDEVMAYLRRLHDERAEEGA